MKLTNWLMGALAFSMLTACSDSDLAERDNSVPGSVSEAVSGYIAVEIKLPQESAATRAEGDTPKPNEDDQTNDKFNDGTPNEYAVENAMILLFKGTSEKNATFFRAQALTKPFFDNQQSQITSSYLASIDVVKDRNKDDHFWAMVILNNNGESTTVLGDNEDGKTQVKVGSETITEGDAFSKILDIKTTNSFLGTDGKSKFFMTNAPLCKVKGGYQPGAGLDATEAPIQYLTDLGTKIWDTPDDAKKNVSGCIYVERAVAKVTYKDNKLASSAFKLEFYNENGEKITPDKEVIEITATVKYALTNTNKTSYLMRNVELGSDSHFSWDLSTRSSDGFEQARMVGEKPMGVLQDPFHLTEDKPLYRTYWCKDPNYGAEMLDGEKNVIMTVTKNGLENGESNFSNLDVPLYCKENTFMVQHQNHKNSTMAIFQVNYDITGKVTDDKGNTTTIAYDHLFIKDGEHKKIYLTKESAAHDEITRIINDNDILNALKLSVKDGAPDDEYSVKDHLDIILARAEKDGKTTQELYVKEIKLKLVKDDKYFDTNSISKFEALIGNPTGTEEYQEYDAEGKPLYTDEAKTTPKKHTPTIQKDLLAKVNALNNIVEYTNGVSYYAIPIMHFGDYYTPWNTTVDRGTTEITGTKTHEVYNSNDENWDSATSDHADKYLGRYGMVRNNWYELNIEEILALGYPSIPDIYLDNNLANDNNETKKYFAVEIHVLSWAKRTQGVKF